MSKPLISRAQIFEAALLLLDKDGLEGLSARKLAATLGCSTRTLYQQVGKRDELVRALLDHHFNQYTLEFKVKADWQECATSWANAMRQALLKHPNLSRLLTVENRTSITSYANLLLKNLLKQGFPRELALRSCRVLIHIVISMSLAEIETPPIGDRRKRRSTREIEFEDLIIAGSGSRSDTRGHNKLHDTPEVFSSAIHWIIFGIRSELTDGVQR
jgi:AcrR family transcriptional regulator